MKEWLFDLVWVGNTLVPRLSLIVVASIVLLTIGIAIRLVLR